MSHSFYRGFPGGPVVKNPSANAGDIGSTSGWGRSTCLGATKSVLHNHWDGALEPTCPGACALQREKPRRGGACALQWESSPRSRQLEKSPAQTKAQRSQKKTDSPNDIKKAYISKEDGKSHRKMNQKSPWIHTSWMESKSPKDICKLPSLLVIKEIQFNIMLILAKNWNNPSVYELQSK